MKITYTQYINNPLGDKSSVVTNRGMYQKMYKEKLDKILLREGGKVKYSLYKGKDKYYVHFRIPSEVIEKFYYDTVIEFYTDDPLKAKSDSLRDYYVKFYSNDPAFVYTFGHAFIKNNLFISDLESKMTKEAITTKAKERNPKNLVGYVKSLFFSYLLIGNYGLFSKVLYDTRGEKYSKSKLLKEIEHAKDKIRKRQEAEADKRRKEQRKKHEESRATKHDAFSKLSPSSKKISKTKLVSSVKRTRQSKRIKNI